MFLEIIHPISDPKYLLSVLSKKYIHKQLQKKSAALG